MANERRGWGAEMAPVGSVSVTGSGPWFVLVTVPGRASEDEARSLIGPFATWDAAQAWRDTRITAEGATAEIFRPEIPR